jgi:hypothetical protein
MTAQAHYERIKELADERDRCYKVAQFILDRHAQDDNAIWVAENMIAHAHELDNALLEVVLF